MAKLKYIKKSYQRFGLKHTLFRGLEYIMLQTHPTASLYWVIVPKYYNYRCSRQLRQYDLPIKPFKKRDVSPELIKRESDRGEPETGALNKVGSIEAGNWDQRHRDREGLTHAPYINETPLYKGLRERFEYGFDWEDTVIYQKAAERIKSGKKAWRSQSIEELRKRCNEIDYIYESMKGDGYKSQRELRRTKPSLEEPFGFINENIMEVAVDIGRDGEILLADGRHRLILAKILDIDKIPVTVIVRHKKWAEKVSLLSFTQEQLVCHPDITAMNLKD